MYPDVLLSLRLPYGSSTVSQSRSGHLRVRVWIYVDSTRHLVHTAWSHWTGHHRMCFHQLGERGGIEGVPLANPRRQTGWLTRHTATAAGREVCNLLVAALSRQINTATMGRENDEHCTSA